eukprot:m.99230 g.99230  ORF g.99230 m.99230 type:complete len:529 (-) comp9027_c0_seq8:2532-4118(-)
MFSYSIITSWGMNMDLTQPLSTMTGEDDENPTKAPKLLEPAIIKQLDNLTWAHIFTFLPPEDLIEVMCCCKQFFVVCQDDYLYSRMVSRLILNSPRKYSIPYKDFLKSGSQANVLRSLLPMIRLNKARWLEVEPQNEDAAMPPVEGHAMAVTRDRFLVLRSGYFVDGPELKTCVLDLKAPSTSKGRDSPIMSWMAVNEPQLLSQAVYGQSLTPLPDGRLLQYGGCRSGGYFQATDFGAYMTLDIDESRHVAKVSWEESSFNNQEHSIGPTSYHCADGIPSDPFKLIFFGGINSTHSISTLAVLDCESNEWLPLADPIGDIPTGRYGFAHGVVGDRFWVLGGADEDDIRQRGRDLRDVYFVNVSDLLEKRMIIWHKCNVEVPNNMFGRETSSVVFGTKIVAIGGSINNMTADEVTNHFHYFDTESTQFGTIRSFFVEEEEEGMGENNDGDGDEGPFEVMPPCHLSSEAVLCGKYFITFGGWTKEGLLEGPFVADLCVEKEKEGDVEGHVETERNEVTQAVRFAIRSLLN